MKHKAELYASQLVETQQFALDEISIKVAEQTQAGSENKIVEIIEEDDSLTFFTQFQNKERSALWDATEDGSIEHLVLEAIEQEFGRLQIVMELEQRRFELSTPFELAHFYENTEELIPYHKAVWTYFLLRSDAIKNNLIWVENAFQAVFQQEVHISLVKAKIKHISPTSLHQVSFQWDVDTLFWGASKSDKACVCICLKVESDKLSDYLPDTANYIFLQDYLAPLLLPAFDFEIEIREEERDTWENSVQYWGINTLLTD